MNANQKPSVAEQAAAPILPGWKALAGFVALSLLLPLILFASAGDLAWTMGWLYVAIVLVVSIGSRLLVWRLNPSLLAERASSFGRSNTKAWDRIFVSVLVGICPLATWILAGLSHRFGWPAHSSALLVWSATGLLVLGGVISAWAMAANRFFSTVVRIQEDRGHTVVSSGPYRFVRHPGYLGAVLVNLAAPLMLQAYWALVPTLLCVVALFARTAAEDRTLHVELPGYPEYAARTRHRLLPFIW